MKRIISLGAGVQSSFLVLAGLEGLFGDIPDAAVFCDTQDEPEYVYEWLDRLTEIVAPFPIIRVSAGCLSENFLSGGDGWIPTYSRNEDGKPSMLKRQCTKHYKIVPLRREVRRLTGPRGKAESWIGISTDEAHRMKPSGLKWLTNRFPLIDARLSREHCADYLKARGFPVLKSSCVECPLKGPKDWARLRALSPLGFAKAVDIDRRARCCRPGYVGEQFLHPSMIPLGDIKEFKHEKQGLMFEDAFGNECEGMCGL